MGLPVSLTMPFYTFNIEGGDLGNGKTISLKAIMKDVQALGHVPLYVKSFQSKVFFFTCTPPSVAETVN